MLCSDRVQNAIWSALTDLEGEQVLELFTNFYGEQILDEEFLDFLEEQGFLWGVREILV